MEPLEIKKTCMKEMVYTEPILNPQNTLRQKAVGVAGTGVIVWQKLICHALIAARFAKARPGRLIMNGIVESE